MATLKQRLHRKNASGTYDVIYFETSADLITGTLSVTHGGTGANNAASARTNLGITPANIGAASSSHTHDNRYYTESEMNTKLNGKANSSHNHAASNITSGTLAVARGGTGQTTITPAIGSALLRAIYAGTGDLAAGSSGLTTGVVYLVYE